MKTLVIFALAMSFITLQRGRPAQTEGVDPRLKMIKEEIEKTTPEGKEIIERVKQMLPEVNGKLSTLPLEKLVENYVKEQNLAPVGWAASKLLEWVTTDTLRSDSLWQIRLLYQTDAKEYRSAQWRYNSETRRLYPHDRNAEQFWSGPTPGGED